MCRVLIFGGTTEGRLLYTYCMEQGISAAVYVATEYGERILDREKENCAVSGSVTIHEGRLSTEEMKEAILREGAGLVLDATHPYAVLATEHIRRAAQALGVPYQRIVRETDGETDGVLAFDTIDNAVAFLKTQDGNIFVTTGSKELRKYTELQEFRSRLYVRILPSPEAVSACIAMGIEGRHLAAMQGPFSEEMNYAFLKEFDIRWMVTKQSGSPGGFPEKWNAAKRAGVNLLVIRRSEKETGISLKDAIHILEGLR